MELIEQHLKKLEKQLLQSSTRKSVDNLAALLADDFIEFSSSGRIFNKQQTIASLQLESPVQRTLSEFKTQQLAPDVVLVTYKITQPTCSLRSSIWKSIDNQWRMVFHQGTKQL